MTEITLHADEEHTYTCVLGSMNLLHFDDWVNTGAVFASTVFLDCVAEDFIQRGKNIKGLEKAVRYTEKARSLGLGAMGFHSYLQSKMLPFGSFDAHQFNTLAFKHICDESLKASEWMAKEWDEPEWCKGYGVRNTHRTAIAPNMSSAVLAGQVSQGIEPLAANIFTQVTSVGEMRRINPQFLKIMDERGKHTKETIKSVIDNNGSVQHLSWLSDHEKLVFRTAFELDMMDLIRMASVRQQYICQGQSLNLFFSADEDELYIAKVHRAALIDKRIKGLYYIRTLAGVQAAKDECIACTA